MYNRLKMSKYLISATNWIFVIDHIFNQFFWLMITTCLDFNLIFYILYYYTLGIQLMISVSELSIILMMTNPFSIFNIMKLHLRNCTVANTTNHHHSFEQIKFTWAPETEYAEHSHLKMLMKPEKQKTRKAVGY